MVGRTSKSKNGRGHFKLVLCCFRSIISHHIKFHPNQTENTEVEYFCCCAVGRFWLVGLVGQKMVVAILNFFYVVFVPSLAPLPNFIQIGQKTQTLEIFNFGQFWLVGVVGRKMVVGIFNSFYAVLAPLLAPIPNFIQIG